MRDLSLIRLPKAPFVCGFMKDPFRWFYRRRLVNKSLGGTNLEFAYRLAASHGTQNSVLRQIQSTGAQAL